MIEVSDQLGRDLELIFGRAINDIRRNKPPPPLLPDAPKQGGGGVMAGGKKNKIWSKMLRIFNVKDFGPKC